MQGWNLVHAPNEPAGFHSVFLARTKMRPYISLRRCGFARVAVNVGGNRIGGMVWCRRNRIARGCWVVASVLAAMAGASASTPIFRDGQALLPVIVAADAVGEERAAADELARVLGIMSGLAWPVEVEDPAGRTRQGLKVGRTRATAALGPPLKVATNLLAPAPGEVGPDAFRLQSREGSVCIEGATPAATAYAVSWLLQREAGVRWYLPGPLGEVIPRRTSWALPALDVTCAPGYVSREISGLGAADAQTWARRNGLRGRLDYSHALNRVFPPPTLAQHPAWAPMLQGQRHLPATEDDYHWQPHLARPEVAAHAARAAAAAFACEPERPSFSLGINDTVRFDQGEATQALVQPLRYFRGRPDYSPLVFAFMNRVAEQIAPEYPERYLGCLAYFWCENPPSFPVHSNVLPYVTTDRSQYYDAAYRAADLELMSRWAAAGGRAYGLWEYAEGVHFLVPRLPLGALAEAVREGWRRGARGYLAEVDPQWGFDAFKVWLLAQLLWEPARSPAVLADDFYAGCYGPAAGPMRRFFARCEAVWMAQPGPPYWLKFYQQEDQALLFPAATCRELRAGLAAAEAAAAADPAVAARVALTVRAFAVTAAYQEFDDARRRLAGIAPADFPVREPTVAEAIARLQRARLQLRECVAAAVTGAPAPLATFSLEPLVRNDPVPRVLWLAGECDPGAPGRLLAAAGVDAPVDPAWRIVGKLREAGGAAGVPNLLRNPAFTAVGEGGLEPAFLHPRSGMLPAEWQVRATPTETGWVARVITGPTTRALRIEGAWDTQAFQWHAATPGGAYLATAQLRGTSSPGNDAGLFLTFLTRSGAVTGTHRMQTLPKGETPEWRTLVLADRAPADAAWVGAGVGVSRQVEGDWLEAAQVELRGIVAAGR